MILPKKLAIRSEPRPRHRPLRIDHEVEEHWLEVQLGAEGKTKKGSYVVGDNHGLDFNSSIFLGTT